MRIGANCRSHLDTALPASIKVDIIEPHAQPSNNLQVRCAGHKLGRHARPISHHQRADTTQKRGNIGLPVGKIGRVGRRMRLRQGSHRAVIHKFGDQYHGLDTHLY